jgi:hypothetical protein
MTVVPVPNCAVWLLQYLPRLSAMAATLIITLTYSFVRISAALRMCVEDVRARSAGEDKHPEIRCDAAEKIHATEPCLG